MKSRKFEETNGSVQKKTLIHQQQKQQKKSHPESTFSLYFILKENSFWFSIKYIKTCVCTCVCRIHILKGKKSAQVQTSYLSMLSKTIKTSKRISNNDLEIFCFSRLFIVMMHFGDLYY